MKAVASTGSAAPQVSQEGFIASGIALEPTPKPPRSLAPGVALAPRGDSAAPHGPVAIDTKSQLKDESSTVGALHVQHASFVNRV